MSKDSYSHCKNSLWFKNDDTSKTSQRILTRNKKYEWPIKFLHLSSIREMTVVFYFYPQIGSDEQK